MGGTVNQIIGNKNMDILVLLLVLIYVVGRVQSNEVTVYLEYLVLLAAGTGVYYVTIVS